MQSIPAKRQNMCKDFTVTSVLPAFATMMIGNKPSAGQRVHCLSVDEIIGFGRCDRAEGGKKTVRNVAYCNCFASIPEQPVLEQRLTSV